MELSRPILIARFLNFEKFDQPFPHVFIFGNLFPDSHGFDAVPVKQFRLHHLLDRDKLEH